MAKSRNSHKESRASETTSSSQTNSPTSIDAGNEIKAPDVFSEEANKARNNPNESDLEVVVRESNEPTSTIPLMSDGKYRNKQRCLTLCSRGVTARYRHLLEDLRTLIPHHKKESKLDPGNESMGRAVNDIASMRSCNTVLFLECRKHQDAYLWLGYSGENFGPSARFLVTNVHTMDELRLTGNCMKGSRPILTFDESFERVEHLKLLKELFVDIFGTPRGHPKSKPFVDRVMAFYYADNKVRFPDRDCLLVLCVSDFKMMSVCRTLGNENKTSNRDYDGMRLAGSVVSLSS